MPPLGKKYAAMQMPIQKRMQVISATKFPVREESQDMVKAPGMAISCMISIEMMRLVVGIPSSPFPYNVADSITVCTPIL